ncbi:5316_t:CDS:2, partial [Entrophospora sp. SA101]
MKINFLTRDIEILIIEQAKDKIVDDIPKNSNDKFKACIEMHDMLKNVFQKTIKFTMKFICLLFLIELDVKVHELSLNKPDLYILQVIGQFSLPNKFCDFSLMHDALITLVKIRFLDKTLVPLSKHLKLKMDSNHR